LEIKQTAKCTKPTFAINFVYVYVRTVFSGVSTKSGSTIHTFNEVGP